MVTNRFWKVELRPILVFKIRSPFCLTQVAVAKTSIAQYPQLAGNPTYAVFLAPGYCTAPPPSTALPHALSAQISGTFTIHTATVQAATCLPSPTLNVPFPGQPISGNTLPLAWETDHQLQPGEMFDVLISPNASDLMAQSDTNQPAIVGRTTERSLTVDLLKWTYAGTLGKFYWGVRIAGADGIF